MNRLPHDDIKPFGETGTKKAQVGRMFDVIAPRYDFMNRFLSAGIDQRWRRRAIRLLQPDQPQYLLDVATGTADMALLAARMLKPERIAGIDISEGMLAKGREKVQRDGLQSTITLYTGDSETINFPNDTFDAVTVAFGVRNFENLERGLQEIFRVMKPGAQVVVLEFSQPRLPVLRQLYQFYMGQLAPQLAGWFRQNKQAYQYLNASAKAFPERRAFTEILDRIGYANTCFKPLSLGICCLYSARKLAP